MFGTTVSDMQEDITVTENTIVGKLKKLTSGSLVDTWGEGYFMALKFSGDATATPANVKVGLQPSVSSGLVALDSDLNGAFKVTDKNSQKFVIQATEDGIVKTKRFDLSGLTLVE